MGPVRTTTLTRHAFWLLIAAGGSLSIGIASVHAHKAVTSKYTYTEEVFPILRDKCGRCHAEGGAAPMSLLSYKDGSGGAVAWAESIREMLVSQAMPPWYADPAGPAVKNNHSLTPRELDVLVTNHGLIEKPDPREDVAANHRKGRNLRFLHTR